MTDIVANDAVIALIQVVMINLVLSIACASVATQLLQVFGLSLAGGILLLWVCWKMWRELQTTPQDQQGGGETLVAYASGRNEAVAGSLSRKTLGQATLQIVVADVSMSLDNVLPIAGAAREHPIVLVFGLLLSIALMGVAADLIARLLNKQRWIAYVGLAIVLYVACEMIYRGAYELKPVIGVMGLIFQ